MKHKVYCIKCGALKPEFTLTSKHLRSCLPEKYDKPSVVVKTAHVNLHLCIECFEKMFPEEFEVHRYKQLDINFVNKVMRNTITKAVIYTHNKTGDHYVLLNSDVIECTNGREDKHYALYCNLDGKIFCRELSEFHQKFTKL